MQIGVVLATAHLLGLAFHRIGQPRVIGEMIAGILLGPSFLGRIAPAALAYLFPVESLGALNVLSQIGLILFLFLVGLQIRPHRNPGVAGAAIAASSASIFTPLVLGAALSVPLPAFALFMGAAMSITAFPVLARILSERGMLNSRAGVISRGIPNYPGEVNVAAAGATGWIVKPFRPEQLLAAVSRVLG
jgi:Kef-type K+ transport system membrane component KefB